MRDRTLAIILTIASVLLCGLPGLCLLLLGAMSTLGSFLEAGSLPQEQKIAQYISFATICLGSILVLFSIGVAFFTMRKPRHQSETVDLNEPIPPPL